MKNQSIIICLVCFFTLCFSVSAEATQDGKQELKVLLVTGGHGYDTEAFDAMLEKLSGIHCDRVEHPHAHAMFKAEKIASYDVVLLYDMPKEISEKAQQDFIAMLEKGKGLVALHHAFCSYDFWPEYTRIIGGRYHHYPWKKDRVEQPVSTYKHDVVLEVKVEDKTHPVMQGIEDFSIIDEAYGLTEILPTVHPLLSTTEATSGPLVCWANTYANSRIITLTLGHDKQSWQNPSFIKLLSQAILWVGR